MQEARAIALFVAATRLATPALSGSGESTPMLQSGDRIRLAVTGVRGPIVGTVVSLNDRTITVFDEGRKATRDIARGEIAGIAVARGTKRCTLKERSSVRGRVPLLWRCTSPEVTTYRRVAAPVT